jgi:hypothetical protein
MGFRVGQKVRIVKHYSGHIGFGRDLLQKTGVIETRFLQAMRDYANKQRTPVDVLRELHGEYL